MTTLLQYGYILQFFKTEPGEAEVLVAEEKFKGYSGTAMHDHLCWLARTSHKRVDGWRLDFHGYTEPVDG